MLSSIVGLKPQCELSLCHYLVIQRICLFLTIEVISAFEENLENKSEKNKITNNLTYQK